MCHERLCCLYLTYILPWLGGWNQDKLQKLNRLEKLINGTALFASRFKFMYLLSRAYMNHLVYKIDYFISTIFLVWL